MNEFLANTDYKIIKTIEEGCSNDKKFFVENFSGDRYLLRISDINEYETKKKEYIILKEFDKQGIACSKPISFGICDNEKNVYTLLEWLEGIDLEKVIGRLDEMEQYSLGLKAGKILRAIHKLKPDAELNDWSYRYNQVISPRNRCL